MTAYVQTSKAGDVISILPILQKESQISGDKIPLVICKEYAPILEGVSYVEPIIWKGDGADVAGAVLFAKKRFSRVIVLQTHGNIPVNRTAPSFQFDQWRRAGAVGHFDEWPLDFDRRDLQREAVLILNNRIHEDKRPTILFGDHSQSSPFLYKEELYSMLKAEFGEAYNIVRLSEIRADRIYDLLGVFDEAAMLVTVETAHVHLSRASKVPTFVLAANGWRGSAFSNRFKFYMRYGEWEQRKHDLIATMKGEKYAVKSDYISGGYEHSYNPSSINVGGKHYVSSRAHVNGTWRTRLFLNGLRLSPPAKHDNFSHEDLRLFEFNSKLHGVYAMSTEIEGKFRCYMAYGEIVGNQIGHIQIRHPENNLLGMTKNFVPFVHEGKLHFIYGIKDGNQIVLQVDGDKVSTEYKSPAPAWGWGQIRGGCVIPNGDALLRFFHSRQDYADKTFRYFAGASIIENKPPFRTLAVSRRPILEGDEEYTPDVFHWKPNVVFPLSAYKEGDKYFLAYGKNDSECRLAELSEHDLNL